MIEKQPFKVDQFWSEVKTKQAANPIMEEDFHAWRNHPVTKRLYEDFEERSAQCDEALREEVEIINVRFVQGVSATVGQLFEWAPNECYGEDQ